MRLAWYSNSPHTPTGYGTQSKQVLRRIKADGHNVDVLANYGDVAGLHDAGVLAQDEGLLGIPVWSQGHAMYSLDVIDDQCSIVFQDEEGWVITLYDDWVLTGALKDYRVASWTPVDHYPVPPEIASWCRKQQKTIAMSRFGESALADIGVESTYIPHAIEPSVFHPVESDLRARMRVPDDAFLIVMNAANVGKSPPRKAWDQNIQAFCQFLRDHKDAYVYLHTDPVRPNGAPIAKMIGFYGGPVEQIRKADLLGYRNGLIADTLLAEIYTAADVLQAVSMGEGFGVPTIEAMACGTPAIVTDFSAQPEIVGDTGWKVPFQLHYDDAHHSCLAMPFVPSIRDALEMAYEERGTETARLRSLAAIARVDEEYNADKVYNERWRPFLAELEGELKPKVRKGMSKSAKRNQMRKVA